MILVEECEQWVFTQKEQEELSCDPLRAEAQPLVTGEKVVHCGCAGVFNC